VNNALELESISKSFDGKKALNLASLSVQWGEVHALLGENGAGKSTIMNVVAGIYTADEGSVKIDGIEQIVRSPTAAAELGIGMVHQHYRLVKRFSIAQNILLSCGKQLGISTVNEAADVIEAKAEEVGFEISPHSIVGQVSIAEQQRAEIIKVLLLGAKIVILDEPTAVLTDQESQAILSFTRRLAEAGDAVILITHKLREVTGYSDRVTVMRSGESVLEGEDTSLLDVESLARHMVGEKIPTVETVTRDPGDVCLDIAGLEVTNPNGGVGVKHVSLKVHQGEIVGIAGVGGNGQQELADYLAGLLQCDHGKVRFLDKDITEAPISERREMGFRTIPSDRFSSGLVAEMSVAENLAMTSVTTGEFGHFLSVSRKRMLATAEETIEQYNILGATPGRMARLLSGGNAQKLLLARELSHGSKLLVAHSPTRGLDVKACHAVHSLIRASVEDGMGCLLISEDLEEVLSLSNHILVMSQGKIVGTFKSNEATPEKIGVLMMGHA
jgi:ABC-type uncharacterized transport system ATPase subunit